MAMFRPNFLKTVERRVPAYRFDCSRGVLDSVAYFNLVTLFLAFGLMRPRLQSAGCDEPLHTRRTHAACNFRCRSSAAWFIASTKWHKTDLKLSTSLCRFRPGFCCGWDVATVIMDWTCLAALRVTFFFISLLQNKNMQAPVF